MENGHEFDLNCVLLDFWYSAHLITVITVLVLSSADEVEGGDPDAE